MFPRGPLFLLLSLAACDDHDIITEPAPVERPTLVAGAYTLSIVDVKEGRCEGVRPEEMVGESVSAQLSVRGEAATLVFGGWRLEGDMAPGNLYVEGSAEVEVEYDDDVDGDVDTSDEEVDTDEAGARASEGSEGREEPETPSDDPYGAFVSLDARILDPGHADGRLVMDVPGCSVELAVELARGEVEEPPVVEEDEPPADESDDEPGEVGEDDDGR